MSEKIKVSELTASTTTNDSDLIMIVQENSNNELENFKQTREDFLAGVYELPSGGIPSTDMTSVVQTSLGKADTALQNTDYANGTTGGVFKTSSGYGTEVSTSGFLRGVAKSYSDYGNADTATIISKGTLDNVLTAVIGDIDTALDLINRGGG